MPSLDCKSNFQIFEHCSPRSSYGLMRINLRAQASPQIDLNMESDSGWSIKDKIQPQTSLAS